MEKTPALPAHEVRPQFEYVYHWHRIIPAMASLAIGVGAVLWFWPASQSTETADTSTISQTQVAQPLKARSVVVDLPLQISKPADSATNTTVSQNGSAGGVSVKSGAEKTVAEKNAAEKNSADKVVASTSNANVSAAGVSATATSNTSTTVAVSAALKAINDAPAPSAGMKPGQIYVVDKSLKDVAIHQVLDQDPLQIDKGSISITQKKAVKVVFGANTGKPNEQINYLWYLNGKLQAKVATRSTPGATSSASKYISYDTPGAWQVQMTNANGKVLAESAFTAKRAQ